MTGFSFDRFQGAVPGIAGRLLQPFQAQDAENCDVRDGDIVPFKGLTSVTTLAKSGTIETVWRWDNSAWFHWASDVDVVDGPVPDDTEARTYYTGDGVPQMTYAGIATSSGDGVFPSNSFNLGVPAPATAPSVSVSGTANDENDIGEDRTYIYTYVSAKGEEGPPTGPSASVLWKPGQTVDVTNMDTAPTGNLNITTKRIYRTATGGESTAFQFVDEINVANTSYNDAIATESLGEVLPSVTWDPPPDNMIGLTAMPNGILAGFRSNELLFSESFLPHAWPVNYRLQTEPDIVAIGAFGNSLVVATRDYPYLVTGTDPSAMAMQRMEVPYPCLAKRSMVDMGFAVVYASTDGLVRFDNNGPRIMTEGLFTPTQWRSFAPGSMHAYRFDDYYVAFYNTGNESAAMLLPLSGDWVMFLSFHASAGWTDPEDGTLYVVQNNDELQSFNTASALTIRWQSGARVIPRPVNIGAARVDADAYPVTFRLIADDAVKATKTVQDGQPFALPGGYRSQRYAVEVEGTSRIRRIEAAESAREIGQL